MIFARIGCLLNGCCVGRPTSGRFALTLPDVRGSWRRRVPTQLIEMLLAVSVLCGAVCLWSRMPFAGGLLLYLMVGYGAARSLIEFTREAPERINVVSSLTLCLVGLGGFLVSATP
jgi:prolipoprotein diacylglyceryltransferase